MTMTHPITKSDGVKGIFSVSLTLAVDEYLGFPNEAIKGRINIIDKDDIIVWYIKP